MTSFSRQFLDHSATVCGPTGAEQIDGMASCAAAGTKAGDPRRAGDVRTMRRPLKQSPKRW